MHLSRQQTHRKGTALRYTVNRHKLQISRGDAGPLARFQLEFPLGAMQNKVKQTDNSHEG